MDFIKSSRGLRVMETWSKCLLLSILYISSRDLWNYFCKKPELSVIIVMKQLHCSNRLLVSLHYIRVVWVLGHAVWNMLIQKCKWLKKCDGCSGFHWSCLDGIWERPHMVRVRVSQGSRIPVLSPRASPIIWLMAPVQNMLMWCLWLEVLSALH